ncbi:MAG: FCD domain-containing protein, partial [Planctomycetia bacterium]
FHATISRLTRSQALQEALEKCHLVEMIRKREISNQTKEELAEWVQNHQTLLDAIASGNPEEAGDAMHKYLTQKK